jgi:hypothetical protein
MRDSVYGFAVRVTILLCSTLPVTRSGHAQEEKWIELTGTTGLDAWKPPLGTWFIAGDARPDPARPRRLVGEPGTGVIVNGPIGKTRNLVSKREFGDIESHFEFLIPEGSNAGVKFQGLYEIQILDSSKKTELSGEDCGGIYPRAELLPKYHHTDHGYPPKVNACKPPGEWQTLDVTFLAPRFDARGKKVANAKFVKVVLNGTVVQDNVEVPSPTGHYWRLPETPRGTLFLQADHGPVAFRNIRIRPLE